MRSSAVGPAVVWLLAVAVVPAAGGDELVWRWDFDSPKALEACRVSEPTKAEIRTVDGATCLSLVRDLGGGSDKSSIVLDSQHFPLRSRCHYRLSCRMKVAEYRLSAASDDRGRQSSMRPPALRLHLRNAKSGALAALGRTVGPGDYYPSPVSVRAYGRYYLGKWQEFALDFFVTQEMDQGRIDVSLLGTRVERLELLIDVIKLELVEHWPVPKYLDAQPPKVETDTIACRRVELGVLGWPAEGGTRWPLCSGIPLPKGELVGPSHVRLTDLGGRPLASQAAAFDRWDDGSVRWLLVDAQAGSGQDRFVLEYGSDVQVEPGPSALKVTEGEERIEVHTGPLQFAVKRSGFDLFDSIALQGEPLLARGKLTLVTADGVVHRAAGDSQSVVRVERRGPLHAVIVGEGWLVPAEGRPRFTYVARIDAYEGMDFVTLAFTFINRSDADTELIKSVCVGLPFAAGLQGWNLCGAQGRGAGWLLQDRHDHFSSSAGTEGKRSSGRVVLDLGQARLEVAVRDWWQNCAKAFEIDEDGLRVDLWPNRYEQPYASRQGEAKTHELLIRFAAPDATAGAAFPCFDALPQLSASPEWNCETEAVGDMLPAPGSPWPWFDEGFAKGVDVIMERRETQAFYGLRDFGDQFRGSLSNEWDNNSRDLSLSLYQQYLRTGEIRYFRLARQMQLHQMDTDTIHHSPKRPEWLGATYCQARNPNHRGKPPSGTFTYVGGQLVYAALTGDERARRLSLRTADFVAAKAGTGWHGYGYCARHTGWPMGTMMTAYEASWDRKYLTVAERLLSCAVAAANSRDKVGTFEWGGSRIAWGYLVYPLCQFYGYTGDERARSAAIKIIDHRVDVCWRPELGGFLYQSPERSKSPGRLSYRGIIELPFVYMLNPRQKYLDVFTGNLPDARGSAGPATARSQKHFAWATRFPPMYLKRYLSIGAPIADAGPDALLPEGRSMELDASKSVAVGGHRIVKYEWDFGDGQQAEGVHVRHTFPGARDYVVTLTCTSSSGVAARASKKVRALLPGRESVLNASFEDAADEDGRPDHWVFFAEAGDADLALDDTVAHSGKRSLRIHGVSQGFVLKMVQRDRPLVSEQAYVISCWVKLDNVVFGRGVSRRQAIRFWLSSQPSRMRGTALAVEQPGTSDWTRYQRRFKSHPNEIGVAATGIFRLQSGTLWIDDFSVRPAE